MRQNYRRGKDISPGAYYVAGYAIELAFKAAIASQFRENEIPDKTLVNNVYTHNLVSLLKLAGLEKPLELDCQKDPELERRWSIVKNWSEEARYAIWTEEQTRAIIDAIDGDRQIGGLFQWLSARW